MCVYVVSVLTSIYLTSGQYHDFFLSTSLFSDLYPAESEGTAGIHPGSGCHALVLLLGTGLHVGSKRGRVLQDKSL